MMYSCLKRFFIGCTLAAVLGAGLGHEVFGQTKNYLTGLKTGYRDGSNASISYPLTLNSGSSTRVDYSGPLLNGNDTTFVNLQAGAILLSSHGAWVTFRNTANSYIPAGSPTYVRLRESPVASGLALLGGLEISGTGIDTIGFNSVSSQAEILVDPEGDYYLAVTPSASYNAVKVGLKFTPGVNLGSSADMALNHMFYYSWPPNMVDCGRPVFSSLAKSSGLVTSVLNLLNLNSLSGSIENPHYAIDSDTETYSVIKDALIGVGDEISQVIHFGYAGNATDLVKIRFAIDTSILFLDLSLLGKIRIQAYRGGTSVGPSFSLNSLIDVNLLRLLTIGQNYPPFEVYIRPMVPYDRIEIKVSGVLSVNVNSGVWVHDVSRVVGPPTISAQPFGSTVCEGQEAILSVSTSTGDNLAYQWASSRPPADTSWTPITGGNTNPLVIPNVPYSLDSTFYRVRVTGGSCPTNLATVESDTASLRVKPRPPSLQVQMK